MCFHFLERRDSEEDNIYIDFNKGKCYMFHFFNIIDLLYGFF